MVRAIFFAALVPLMSQHRVYIQSRIDYFNHAPVVHFDENSDRISSFSELAGAIQEANNTRANIPNHDGIQQAGGDVDQDEVVLPRQTDGDQFEPLNKEGLDRDHQFHCEIFGYGDRCNRSITFNSYKQHWLESHDIPKDKVLLCPWYRCGEVSYRKNLERHIKTIHLRFKRLSDAR